MDVGEVRAWRDVGAEVDLDDKAAVQVGRHSILLCRVEGAISAVQNICPHERCELVEGNFVDGTITCPGHNWCFDARTGAGLRPRGARLARYDTRVVAGRIEVALR